MVCPPSQITTVLLKLIIFMFLIPKAPSVQRNTLCGKGSDFSRVKSTVPAVQETSVPISAGCQGTPQQRAPTLQRYLIQAGKTHQTRGRGNQNANTGILSPLTLPLF